MCILLNLTECTLTYSQSPGRGDKMFGIERVIKDPVKRAIQIMPVIFAVLMTTIAWNLGLNEFAAPGSMLGAFVLWVYLVVGGYVFFELLHKVLKQGYAPDPLKQIDRLSDKVQERLLCFTWPVAILYLAPIIFGLPFFLVGKRLQAEHKSFSRLYQFLMSKPLNTPKLGWFRPLYVVALMAAIAIGLIINEDARMAVTTAIVVFLGVSAMPWVILSATYVINRVDSYRKTKSVRQPHASTGSA